MTAVMARPEAQVADRFRFSDTNPLTGQSYALSRWDDLPGFVVEVVEEFGMSPAGWDRMVGAGGVFETFGWRETYPIQRWLNWQRARRDRQADRSTCPDCWGTCVQFDEDGSCTGRRGAPMWCCCTLADRKAAAGRRGGR